MTTDLHYHYIVRIDQPEKKNHGYYVRITRDNVEHGKFFADKKHGGSDFALIKAITFRQKLKKQLGLKPSMVPNRRRDLPKSGVMGVTFIDDRGYQCWKARVTTATGIPVVRKFSIKKLGNEKALKLAIQALRYAQKHGYFKP